MNKQTVCHQSCQFSKGIQNVHDEQQSRWLFFIDDDLGDHAIAHSDKTSLYGFIAPQAFPVNILILVAQNCHKAPVVLENVCQVDTEKSHAQEKKKCMRYSINISAVVPQMECGLLTSCWKPSNSKCIAILCVGPNSSTQCPN